MQSFELGKDKNIIFPNRLPLLERGRRERGRKQGRRGKRRERRKERGKDRWEGEVIFLPSKNSKDSLDKDNPSLINILTNPSLK